MYKIRTASKILLRNIPLYQTSINEIGLVYDFFPVSEVEVAHIVRDLRPNKS
ncbi:hypothetical protein J6590_081623, partial [Homalodisca vitripennis]